MLTADRKNEYLMLDSTLVRTHQQAATGKRGNQNQVLGRSRGGLTTKIHMLVDSLGRPLRFALSPGQAHDITEAAKLLDGESADYVLGDRAYDANSLRETIAAMGATAVIPYHPRRKQPYEYDRNIYRLRNRIERCFNKLKHCDFDRLFGLQNWHVATGHISFCRALPFYDLDYRCAPGST